MLPPDDPGECPSAVECCAIAAKWLAARSAAPAGARIVEQDRQRDVVASVAQRAGLRSNIRCERLPEEPISVRGLQTYRAGRHVGRCGHRRRIGCEHRADQYLP
jgi:hypothetical protein